MPRPERATLYATALLTLFACAGTVVPLYLFQLGMERLKPLQIALMISAGPLITLLLQAFDPRLHWSPFSVVGTSAATLLVAWSAIDGSPRPGRVAIERSDAAP